MKTFASAFVLTALLLISAAAPAQPLPMVYEAVTLASTDGNPGVAVVPRSIPLQIARGRTPDAQSVMRIFEGMRNRFPGAYGAATISISTGRDPAVTINLDPARNDNWSLVVAETFYTMKSFGFATISAPLYHPEPLSAVLVDAIVMVPIQPWFRAAADNPPATMMVALDQNRMLSMDAFTRLLSTGNPEIVKVVQDGLNSRIQDARVAAVRTLGSMKPPPPDFPGRIPSILKDSSAAVRMALLDLGASGKLQIPQDELRKTADSDPDPEIRLAAAKILAAGGVRDYDHVLEVRNLRSGNPSEVAAALRRLKSAARSDTAPAVAQTLSSADVTVRNLAVEVLTSMKAASVMSRAITAGDVPAAQKAELAAQVIRLCPMDENASVWLATSGSTEQASLGLVSACGQGTAQPPAQAQCGKAADPVTIIGTYTRRPEQVLRDRAIDCLGSRQEASALDALVPLLQDPQTVDRAARAAASVLSRQPQPSLLAIISGRGVPPARATRQFRLLALDALAAQAASGPLEQAALAVLKGLMKDQDIEIRRAAVGAMARAADSATASLVLDGIDDQDEGIRRAAVLAAGRIPGPTSEQVLRRSLEDVSVQVRAAGLEAMAERPLPGTRQRLQMLANNARPEIRRPAVSAFLKTLGPEDEALRIQFVSTLLYDQSEEIRIIAVGAMEDMTDTQSTRAVGALVIDQSPRVRSELARVLGRMRNDTALDLLKKMARDGDPAVRRSVADALGRFRTDQSTPVLTEMKAGEKDPSVISSIERSLNR